MAATASPPATAGEPPSQPSAARPVGATLSLDEAIALALEYSPQVQAARQGVNLAAAQVTQAMSALMPNVSVTATRDTPIHLPALSFRSTASTWTTELSLSQPLYTGGATEQGVRAAHSYLAGAGGGYRRTQQSVAFSVRQAYYQVLTAAEQVKVAEEVVNSAQEHLRVAKLRYEAGVAPQFDVLAAEARVAQDEQALIAAQADLAISQASLGTVVGVPIPPETQLTTPRPVAVTEADQGTLVGEALGKRPDLLSVKATEAATAALIAAARGARQPTVTAALSYTLRPTVTLPPDLLAGTGEIVISQSSGDALVVASWKLFDGGLVTGQIRAAQAEHEQAKRNVEALRLQVELEVKSSQLLLQSAQAQVAAAQKEVAQATEAQRIATLRYQEGVGTSVEILDAEAALGGAKTRLNSATYALNLAVAKLDLAVGRDWAPAEPPPAEAPR
jgi:outer membrane protein TolC